MEKFKKEALTGAMYICKINRMLHPETKEYIYVYMRIVDDKFCFWNYVDSPEYSWRFSLLQHLSEFWEVISFEKMSDEQLAELVIHKLVYDRT